MNRNIYSRNIISNEDYKNYKHRFYICKNCYNQNNSDIECMVCLDVFKQKDMIYTACDNDHKTCTSCYSTLQKYTDKCPMCRGAL